MLEFLKRRLKSEKGAMDSILVTLLLIIIAIGAVVGIKTWMTNSSSALLHDANQTLSAVSDANVS